MRSLESAGQVLRRAEEKIRELVSTAATESDYDAVSTLAGIAKQLRELYAELPGGTEVPVAEVVPTKSGKKGKDRARLAGRGYPKFRVEGAYLVKTGWSKASKSEYEHRAPREVIERMSSALAEKSGSNGPISTESLLPLNAADGSEVPSYQAYLALAWLRSEALVEVEGRKGYTISIKHLLPEMRKRWDALAAS